MANTSSAKKASRAAARRKVYNERRRRAMRSSVKGFKKGASATELPGVYQAIDKALKRGIIKKNTAARMKSKVAKLAAAK